MMVRKVQLLGTSGCHLCDVAEGVLKEFNGVMHAHGFQLEVELVDISISEAMVAAYGIKIPVVIDTVSSQELTWPFDAEQVYEFLRAADSK